MAEKALRWIVQLMQKNDMPFLLCGGLAALEYGSKRPLNDIDLFVPSNHFQKVVELGQNYVSKPAQHYYEKAEGWDLEYVQFKYGETKIEVGNANGVKIFDSKANKWIDLQVDFSRFQLKTIFGVEVRLMTHEDLIKYKRILRRPVDLQDIEAMRGKAW